MKAVVLNKRSKQIIVSLLVLLLTYFGFIQPSDKSGSQHNTATSTATITIAEAYQRQATNFKVTDSGKVVKVLRDDTKGSKHQRFILRLSSGHTLLIAHNIDLAPRVAGLQVGDSVEFKGVYEWNADGGVVHWTHHDPQKFHESGWLKHDGHVYQ